MHDRPLYAPLTQTRELYLRKQFCCSHARILSSRRGGFQYFALKAGRQHLDDRGGSLQAIVLMIWRGGCKSL